MSNIFPRISLYDVALDFSKNYMFYLILSYKLKIFPKNCQHNHTKSLAKLFCANFQTFKKVCPILILPQQKPNLSVLNQDKLIKKATHFKQGFFQLPEPDVEAQECESLLKDSEAGDTLLEVKCSQALSKKEKYYMDIYQLCSFTFSHFYEV